MERVSADEVDATVLDDGTVRRGLSAPLGATHLAVNRYRVPPGGGFPGGVHAHADQEEVFIVLGGTATFETVTGEVTVGKGEAIRFAPGEFQTGRNRSDVDLVAVALGAPRDSEDVRVPMACPECDAAEMRVEAGAAGAVFGCPACDAERVPRPCPECGRDELRFSLPGGPPAVVVCPACDADFERPPLRE